MTYIHRPDQEAEEHKVNPRQAEEHKRPISLSHLNHPVFSFLPALPTQLRSGSLLSTHHEHQPPWLYPDRARPIAGTYVPRL
jgi:hypothetical protein